MRPAESGRQPVRLAVFTYSISHFEAPLFRLCAQSGALQFRVFYIQPVVAQFYDSEYVQQINWGDNLLSGYDSDQVADANALIRTALEWEADVILIYGYSWPGAPKIILYNWLRGHAQIHRGTLNCFPYPGRSYKERLLRSLRPLLLRLFQAHHYGGDYSWKVLLDAGAKKSSLFFVPYSVDTPRFLAASSDSQQLKVASEIRFGLGWMPDDHVILFIAQLNWIKGPDIAMEVFRHVAQVDPKARFLVVGSGRMTDTIKADAKKYLDLKTIHFAGFVPSAQTVPYYLASDLALCASRYETWARMVNEAMLCRCPCLVSRLVAAAGGLVEHNVNGYVVESPEANQFSLAIERHFKLLPEEQQRMRNAACQNAQAFAYELHMDNVIAAARYALTYSRRGKAAAKPK